MKKLIIFLLFIPIVYGASLNDTIMTLDSINTTYNLTYPTIFTSTRIATDYLYLNELSQSNPAQTSTYTITTNITCSNANYTHLDLPYYSLANLTSTQDNLTITSNLCNLTNVTTSMQVTTCSYSNLVAPSYQSASCTGTTLTLTELQLETGNNTITMNSTTPAAAPGGGGKKPSLCGNGVCDSDAEIESCPDDCPLFINATPIPENVSLQELFAYCSARNMTLKYIQEEPYCVKTKVISFYSPQLIMYLMLFIVVVLIYRVYIIRKRDKRRKKKWQKKRLRQF